MGADGRPRWQGVHHLALVTPDMDATVRFWHGVLGARLAMNLATDSFRHYFFEFDQGCTVAFFEYRDQPVARFAKPAGIPSERAAQFDHLALGLEDEEALLALRNRLKEHDCEVTEVVDHGVMRSIYFTDPNGLALEASCWVVDPTRHDDGYDDAVRYADPDPVPAVRELRARGALEWTPRTTLVDEEVDVPPPVAG
ncbi:MAG TPA: VOC family protein [Microthrixaceae bacterium]|nr:VOC family protein [Microthrixaceae bacterium]